MTIEDKPHKSLRIKSSLEEQELLSKQIKENFHAADFVKILEAGCGRRWPLDISGSKYHLTGVDLDRDAIETRKKNKDRIIKIIIDLLDTGKVKSTRFTLDKALLFEEAAKSIKEELKEGGERSFLFWGFVTKVEKKDKPALKALDLLLSDRIIFDVREKQGRAYRMRAGTDLIGDHALFYINLGTRPANIEPLLPQILGFFDQKVVESFTEYDLEKSLNMYILL